jgi:hypothetical protein
MSPGPSFDELWREWVELDRSLTEADEKAQKEAAGEFDLYWARMEEFRALIMPRFNEIEEQIADMVPTTIGDVLIQLRLLNARWPCEPDELDDRLVANLLAGVEAMAAGGG